MTSQAKKKTAKKTMSQMMKPKATRRKKRLSSKDPYASFEEVKGQIHGDDAQKSEFDIKVDAQVPEKDEQKKAASTVETTLKPAKSKIKDGPKKRIVVDIDEDLFFSYKGFCVENRMKMREPLEALVIRLLDGTLSLEDLNIEK